MKRLFSILLCAALIGYMSAVSFADSKQYVSDVFPGIVVDKGDGNTYLGTFDLSSMSDDVKEFVMDFWSNSSSEYNYWIDCSSNKITIYRYSKSDSIVYTLNTNAGNRMMLTLSSKSKFEYVYFVLSDGLLVSGRSDIGILLNPTPTRVLFPPSIFENLVDSQRLYYSGDLGFVDNEEPEPEEPSSSEPSSSSESPIVPDVPTIENDYIPYDTSLWNGFLEKVLDYIRKAAKIGLRISGILCGLWLIKRVVKIFVR